MKQETRGCRHCNSSGSTNHDCCIKKALGSHVVAECDISVICCSCSGRGYHVIRPSGGGMGLPVI